MIDEKLRGLIIRENRKMTKYIIAQRKGRSGVRMEVPCRGRSVPVWMHKCPGGGPAPAFFYLHSGGMSFGTADENDVMLETMAVELGMHIVGIDYRLCPENDYMDGLADVCETLEYFYAMGESFGMDTERFVIGGASAGGALAAATLFEREKYTFGEIKAQVIFYPAMDNDSDPHRRPLLEGSIEPDTVEMLISAFAPDAGSRRNKLISPVFATREEALGMPPAIIIAAQMDAMTGDAEAYARLLRSADVPVHYQVFKGAGHNFIEYGLDTDTLDKMPESMNFCKVEAYPMMARDVLVYIRCMLNKALQ